MGLTFAELEKNAVFQWSPPPEDPANGRLVKDGPDSYFPEGGGFGYRCPDPTRPVVLAPALTRWRAGRFCLDAADAPEYDGYHLGESWNGWAVPYFPWEACEKIAADVNRNNDVEGARIILDPEKRTVTLDERPIYGDDAPEAELRPDAGTEIAAPDGARIVVYDIGGGNWCWMEVKLTPEQDAHGEQERAAVREMNRSGICPRCQRPNDHPTGHDACFDWQAIERWEQAHEDDE